MNVVTKNAVPRRRSTPRELMIALIDDHRGAYVVEPICKIVADRPFDLPYAYSPPVGAAERLFFCIAWLAILQCNPRLSGSNATWRPRFARHRWYIIRVPWLEVARSAPPTRYSC